MPRGFSLVEFLVVLFIIGVLVAVLLPAVQAVREAGRNSDCQNRLRQIGLALQSHHAVQNHFPYGGWGHEWVGVPGRGSGRRQPGSWIYGILPLLEEGSLHKLGLGLAGAAADAAYSTRLSTPLPLFTCPTKRPCNAWPIDDAFAYVRSPQPFGNVNQVARADYAINAGTSLVVRESGPTDLVEGDSKEFWRNREVHQFTGICHLHIGVNIASIDDGTSNTYLVGEKYLHVDRYEDGTSPGDNESLYSGYCSDLHRFTGITKRLAFNLDPYAPPLKDDQSDGVDPPADIRFGSAHPNGFNMVYCDGSVRHLDFQIDADIHLRSGDRHDKGKRLDRLN